MTSYEKDPFNLHFKSNRLNIRECFTANYFACSDVTQPNVSFLSKRTPTISVWRCADLVWDVALRNPTDRNIRGRQMCPPLHQPPKWQSQLILPKDDWPDKDYSYTVRASIQKNQFCRQIAILSKTGTGNSGLLGPRSCLLPELQSGLYDKGALWATL